MYIHSLSKSSAAHAAYKADCQLILGESAAEDQAVYTDTSTMETVPVVGVKDDNALAFGIGVRKMRAHSAKVRGFTLLEMIAMLVVITILSLVVVTQYRTTIARTSLESALTHDRILIRNVTAILSLNPTLAPEQGLQLALSEIQSSALSPTPGVSASSASGTYSIVSGESTDRFEYSWFVDHKNTVVTNDDVLITLRYFDDKTTIGCYADLPKGNRIAGCGTHDYRNDPLEPRDAATFGEDTVLNPGVDDFGPPMAVLGPTVTEDSCKNGGWLPQGFRNQGQCVSRARANINANR